MNLIIVTTFLSCVAVKCLELIRTNSEKSSKQASEMLAHEYELISKYLFEGTCSELKQFSRSRTLLSLKTKQEKQKWFVEHIGDRPEFFHNVIYINYTILYLLQFSHAISYLPYLMMIQNQHLNMSIYLL